MAAKKLSRTTYRDPTLPGTPVRTGDSARAENAADMDQYFRPLHEVHGSGAHDWGVASGLEVTATLDQQNLRVKPGIAVDVAGRHISLAAGGNAEIGTSDPPMPATPVAVTAQGATIPTASLTGTRYVTIEWWEAFDTDAYNHYSVYRYLHTPWIRLPAATGFSDDGQRIVLAKVTLDAQGRVTGLSHEKRRNAGLPVETLRLRQGRTASPSQSVEVDSVDAGRIQPRQGGGLEILVPDAGDELLLAADRIVGRRDDGKETIVLDTRHGSLYLGTEGADGDLVIRDGKDRMAFLIDGDKAEVYVGTSGNDGHLYIVDDAGGDSIRLDGAPGDITFRGKLCDPAKAHSGVGHDLLKLMKHLPDLTDGRVTSRHKHHIGRIGYSGEEETGIGIVSGRVILKIDYMPEYYGRVRIVFSTHSFSASGSGFNRLHIHGYKGEFNHPPHAIAAPTQLYLSTRSDTWAFCRVVDITDSHLDIEWGIDTSRGLEEDSIDFLVIGGISE